MHQMINSLGTVVSPNDQISSLLEQVATGAVPEAALCLDYTLTLAYLDVPVDIQLVALYLASFRKDGSVQLSAAVTDQAVRLRQLMDQFDADFHTLCHQMGLSILDLTSPLLLETVAIAKPWGQEIWYTGCEARGVSSIQGVPLPWVISLYPAGIMGTGSQIPLLLKILDPLADPVFGDLYYEMHTQKKEVYVITHVDRAAWPDGKGRIRYGFSPAKRASFQDDGAFRTAYLAAVRRYEDIRRQIDQRLDDFRRQEGYGLNAPVPAMTLSTWQARLPAHWLAQEQSLRDAMDSFTGARSLGMGDVISIATHTPHALQHGVRAVEFQTPHYERQILSFAQKVLTQARWDTESALETANLDVEPPIALDIVYSADGVVVESIARFDQFAARRITLDSGCTYQPVLDTYFLLMTITGYCECGTLQLTAEQACLVPSMSLDHRISNHSSETVQCLLAYPTA